MEIPMRIKKEDIPLILERNEGIRFNIPFYTSKGVQKIRYKIKNGNVIKNNFEVLNDTDTRRFVYSHLMLLK